MSSITLTKDISIEKIESHLKTISNLGHSVNIRIPQKFSFSGILGVEAALIQFVITWSRINDANELHTFINEIAIEKILEGMNSSLLGICALSLAPKITDESHNSLHRYDCLKHAKAMINAMDTMNYQETGKGPEVNLVSISGAAKEYIRGIYNKSSAGYVIKSSEEWENELRKIIPITIKPLGNFKSFESRIQKLYSPLGLAIRELFQNIEDHAKIDFTGNEYIRTVSGLKVNAAKLTTNQLHSRQQFTKGYLDYLENYLFDDQICFLEISIFDSGPGLARRWTNKNYHELQLIEEKDAVISCLLKNNTTKKEDKVGMGLPMVIAATKNLGGCLRIRSGRTCFVKEFDRPECEYVPSENEFLQSHFAPAEGLTVTICIPF